MALSNNFGFGDDETMLRDSARKFFADNCPPDRIHAQVAHDYDVHREIECIWDRKLWQQIVDLGWTAVCVPEAAGGVGMPAVAAIALAEEAGKAAFPSPLMSTFNATFVLRECEGNAATDALGAVAGGTPMTLAITNEAGSWEAGDTDVTVERNTLSGTAYFVQDAKKADSFVVSARGRGSGAAESGPDRTGGGLVGAVVHGDERPARRVDGGHRRFDPRSGTHHFERRRSRRTRPLRSG